MSLNLIRTHRPLVHCMTNAVVMNFTANGLLSVGASPIMADAMEEVSDIVQIADALLINIGTLNARTVASMNLAIEIAAEKNIPIVLDPVGAGATRMKLTQTNVRKAAGMEHIQCGFPLHIRYAAPVHSTNVARI